MNSLGIILGVGAMVVVLLAIIVGRRSGHGGSKPASSHYDGNPMVHGANGAAGSVTNSDGCGSAD